MKKLICMLSLLAILMNGQTICATWVDEAVDKNMVEKYGLEQADYLPDGIKPIYVDSEEELIKLLAYMDSVFSDKGTVLPERELLYREISQKSLGTLIISNKTITHTETIFDLNSIGGKIVQPVNYTYSYWVAPESYTI